MSMETPEGRGYGRTAKVKRNDASYFEHRAASEVELAQRASHPNAVKAHHLMAEAYLQRLAGYVAAASVEPGTRLS